MDGARDCGHPILRLFLVLLCLLCLPNIFHSYPTSTCGDIFTISFPHSQFQPWPDLRMDCALLSPPSFLPFFCCFSFVFRRESTLFDRRTTKIVTSIVSEFTAQFVYHWDCFFPDQKVRLPPSYLSIYPSTHPPIHPAIQFKDRQLKRRKALSDGWDFVFYSTMLHHFFPLVLLLTHGVMTDVVSCDIRWTRRRVSDRRRHRELFTLAASGLSHQLHVQSDIQLSGRSTWIGCPK